MTIWLLITLWILLPTSVGSISKAIVLVVTNAHTSMLLHLPLLSTPRSLSLHQAVSLEHNIT
jgi:hypothetical protein